jgi:hypothetical protein
MKRKSQTPFLDGYRAGSADRYIGRALDVSLCSFDTEPEYVRIRSRVFRRLPRGMVRAKHSRSETADRTGGRQ